LIPRTLATRRPKLRNRSARAAKKATTKPKGGTQTNKKAEIIAMMQRAKGGTLAEIMKATDWHPHTVRGFVSFLGSKVGRGSSRPRTPRVNERTRSRNSFRRLIVQTPPRLRASGGGKLHPSYVLPSATGAHISITSHITKEKLLHEKIGGP